MMIIRLGVDVDVCTSRAYLRCKAHESTRVALVILSKIFMGR